MPPKTAAPPTEEHAATIAALIAERDAALRRVAELERELAAHRQGSPGDRDHLTAVPTGAVTELPVAQHALTVLHQEIQQLAVAAGQAMAVTGAAPHRRPQRVERRQGPAGEEVINYWLEGDITVLTSEDYVHLAMGVKMASWPDWWAISPEELRELVNALLSAQSSIHRSGGTPA